MSNADTRIFSRVYQVVTFSMSGKGKAEGNRGAQRLRGVIGVRVVRRLERLNTAIYD